VALAGALDRAAGESVGNYAIGQGTLINANNPNYLLIYVGDTFGITQRPVTVTADAGQSKLFGSPDPVAFSFTNTSLGGGVALAGALSRVPGESGGSYPIGQGTLIDANNPNYLLTYIGDNFTIIGQPPPVVTPSNERVRVAIVDADQEQRERRAHEVVDRRTVYRLENGGIKLPEGER
jgi:MBG domain (YGX type)